MFAILQRYVQEEYNMNILVDSTKNGKAKLDIRLEQQLRLTFCILFFSLSTDLQDMRQ